MEERNNKTATTKKVLRIVGDVLIFLLVAIALFAVILSIVSKKDTDGTATVFGTQLRFVQSSSMEKCAQTDVSKFKIKSIPVRSCVFVQVVPQDETQAKQWFDDVQLGDVLTIKYVVTNKQETITHRVIDKRDNGIGGWLIVLQGDNKPDGAELATQTINTSLHGESKNYVVGKVVGQNYLLGLLVYAFKTPVGLVCMVIIPCLIIIVFEILRLARVFNADKKQKIQAQQQQQADEIENLKRQLAQLQSITQPNDQTELSSDDPDVK